MKENPSYNEQLFDAVKRDDLEAAEAALKNGANVNFRLNPALWNNRDAATSFCNALLRGNEQMVRLLLDNGADPNAELSNAYDYQTYSIRPLMLAVEGKFDDVVKLLLERGADTNCDHRFGKEDDGVGSISPLGQAMKQGSRKIVEMLRGGGASPYDVFATASPIQKIYTADEWAEKVGDPTRAPEILEEGQGGDIEPDWLKCDEGGIGYAIEQLRFDPSKQRKLFLAGCGWARRFWKSLGSNKHAVETFERFADQEVAVDGFFSDILHQFIPFLDFAGLFYAHIDKDAKDAAHPMAEYFKFMIVAENSWNERTEYVKGLPTDEQPQADRDLVLPARGVFSLSRGAYIDASDEFSYASGNRAAEYQAQCDILRDVFGNPSRSVSLEPVWLSSNEGAVEKIAAAIYDERAFDRMPELADALEKSGCNEQHILAHCRSQGEHVRGCWVIDLLLAKDKLTFPLGARMPLAFHPGEQNS